MENHLAVCPLHVQNTFVTQHAGAINIDDGTQKIFQFGGVQRSVCFENKAFDVVVVVMVVTMTMTMAWCMVMIAMVVMLV